MAARSCSECENECQNAERRYPAVILFSVYDGGVKLVAEPHLAQSIDSAKLSLGRFFVEHEDMRDRMAATQLIVFGEWDPSYGLSSHTYDIYEAVDCYNEYLKEVQKQNEEAVSDSDASI